MGEGGSRGRAKRGRGGGEGGGEVGDCATHPSNKLPDFGMLILGLS